MQEKIRCAWSYTGNNPLYIEYHDSEWGVPLHDDNRLFEMLVLEGAQAGRSWLTVLKKRDSFRKAFANFDPEAVSLFGESHINELMNNPEIIRNERKIKSASLHSNQFLKPEAFLKVVIHQACRLHICITDSRTHKTETSF